MRYFFETGQRRSRDALGRRIRRHELGMRLLDDLELMLQVIERGDRYELRVLDMVRVAVAVDRLAELLRAFADFLSRLRHQRILRLKGGMEKLRLYVGAASSLVLHPDATLELEWVR